jgi:hypothetical protein
VPLDQLAKVHAIQLVAGENEHFRVIVFVEVPHVATDGVGRALIPAPQRMAVRRGDDVVHRLGLLRRENFDEAAVEHVEAIRIREETA